VIVLDDGALPVVMAVVRGAFGRHAWTMQLRHQSRSRKVSFCYSVGRLSDIYTTFALSSFLLQCIKQCAICLHTNWKYAWPVISTIVQN